MPKRSRSHSHSPSSATGSPFIREDSSDSVKVPHLDPLTATSQSRPVMRCLLPPHQPLSFSSFEEYDVHYQKTHVNRCSECRKNFPDEHFLNLHIAENHDPITEARKARGEKTYACLVAGCDRFCSTPQKRRMHCVDKHQFPKFYDFFIVNDGIDRRNSMLRSHRRRSSTATSTTSASGGTQLTNGRRRTIESERMDVVDDEAGKETTGDDESTISKSTRLPVSPRGSRGRGRGNNRGRSQPGQASIAEDPIDNITSGMSALQFVPNSVRFGRGRGKAGFAKS